MDRHAPVKSKLITNRSLAPWFSDDLRVSKVNRRKAERLWKRTRSIEHRDILRKAKLEVNNLVSSLKRNYYRSKIDSSKSSKALFSVVGELLHTKSEPVLPESKSDFELASCFTEFFCTKVRNIRAGFPSQVDQEIISDIKTDGLISALDHFKPASVEEILEVISNCSKSTCDLDPIPTTLLKDCDDQLSPVVTNIVNSSFSSNIFPSSLKTALVKPLLKKATLDKNNLTNYRPISNLPFLSKVIERVVASRLNDHLINNNLYEKMQSAYRTCHSTETALIKVHSDILQAIDNRKGVILVLLDLSAAFDTIDHNILISRLHIFGINDAALDWFRSYITSRSQRVSIRNELSDITMLPFGVPQGSVLRPILFILYTKPLADICRRHGINVHLYADDTQLYLPYDILDPADARRAVSQMESCLRDIKQWMTVNKLKLNEDKTEVINITSLYYKDRNLVQSINVGITNVPITTCARNIGVIFDSTLSMNDHISSICKTAYFHLKNIGLFVNFLLN